MPKSHPKFSSTEKQGQYNAELVRPYFEAWTQRTIAAPEISRRVGLGLSATKRALYRVRKSNGAGEAGDEAWNLIEEEAPVVGKSSIKEEGNRSTAEHVSPIRTLEGLIEACQIDTEVWEIERWVANQWQQGAKINDRVEVTPLWQVKAWMVRKEAVKTQFPAIRPVMYQLPKPTISLPKTSGTKTAFIIPDSQNGYLKTRKDGRIFLEPFHDRKAWDAVLQLAFLIKPDVIILLGDLLDLPDWTDKFLRTPDFSYLTQATLNELGWLLSRLRYLCPQAEIIYLEGNHEFRMRSATLAHLSAAFDLKPANAPESAPAALSVPHLLNLSELNIKYLSPYPSGEYWLNDNLSAGHGDLVRSGSGDTVKALLKELRYSHICGHIHRCEMASETRYMRGGPRTYQAISPGTITRLDGPVPKAKKRMNWSQGCAVIHYEQTGKQHFQASLYPIWDGRILYGNQVVQGEDYLELFQNETGCDLAAT